ncbi:MAG: SIS domain-containing protein, partial [Candidatus Asgardarchaeia archaeon]
MALEAKPREKHPFYMYDYIHEQPDVVEKTLREEEKKIEEVSEEIVRRGYRRVVVTGSGTSYHKSMISVYALEKISGLMAKALPAYEFVNYPPKLSDDTFVISISRSGQKGDPVNAVKIAKGEGAFTVALTNNPQSPIAKIADTVIATHAGKEYAGPRTKGYTTALSVIYLFSLKLAEKKGTFTEWHEKLEKELKSIPNLMRKSLKGNEEKAKELSRSLKDINDFVFIGGGPNYVTALESALKMKEANFTHSEGIEVSEFMHGPIMMVERDWGVSFFLQKESKIYDKLMSVARGTERIGCHIFAVSDHDLGLNCTTFMVPEVDEMISPILQILPI